MLEKVIFYIFRLEGYFYKDTYIGNEPNEKIKKKMAKRQRKNENASNVSVAEQTWKRYN